MDWIESYEEADIDLVLSMLVHPRFPGVIYTERGFWSEKIDDIVEPVEEIGFLLDPAFDRRQ